jgi:phage tail sheath protein FI
MPFQVSPGVSVREIDLSTTIPSVSTTDGGTVIQAQWGPTEEVTLVSDEQALIRIFGRPSANASDNTHASWLGAANFLGYSNKLRVVRANTGTLNAGSGSVKISIKNHNHFTESVSVDDTYDWVSRYPGIQGNSLKVSVASTPGAYSNAAVAKANTTLGSGGYTAQTQLYVSGTNGGVIEVPSFTVGDFISFPELTYPSQSYRITNISADPEGGATATQTSNTFTIFPALKEDLVDDTVIQRDWEYKSYFSSSPTKTSWAHGYDGDPSGGGVSDSGGDALHVAVVDADGGITGVRGTVLETFPALSKAKNATDPETGRPLYYVDAINERSSWVYWASSATKHPAAAADDTEWGTTVNSASVTFGGDATPNNQSLSGGDIEAATDGQLKLAYDKFLNTEDVDISVIFTNDASPDVSKHVIQNIAETRKDVVVCTSPARGDVVPDGATSVEATLTKVLTWRNDALGVSSSYGIADSGWKYVLDKYSNKYRWIPLNSDVAGCIVRTDTERDPWYSPAGYNRGQIKNSIRLAWNPNKAQRDDLYSADINPVVTFPGRGTVLFGDKTLYGRNSAFDRINVRRLFIVLEKAIATASKFTLFEFNDEFTRAQFRNMVEPFLRDVKGRRGITDFKVVCDESNNTGSVVDRNEFVGDIYIKPARSINYIQLNFIAAATGVEFSEIVGQAS